MAQGAPKKTGGSSSSSSSSKSGTTGRANKPQPPKKGARVAKAKAKAKKGKGSSAADKLQRKLAAGITAKTERLLGARAGHLELIGPGKKARGLGTDKDGKGKGIKGGSRKFG